MRIIDRYIAKRIIFVFITTMVIFCTLYILIDAASNLDEIIKRKVPFLIMASYYVSSLPIMVVQTASVACLIAALLTFGQLNSNNEIIPLRTSGMNFWQIAKPAIFFGLVVSAFIFWFNEKFVPQATAISNQIRNENIILETDSQKNKAKIKNLTFYGLKNRLYFIDSFDPNNYEIDKITVLGQDDDQNMKEKIVALKGKWTGIVWKFYQCQITVFHPADVNAADENKFYEEKIMDIRETPQDFLRQRLDVTSMNLRQLHDYIIRFSKSGATKALNNLRVDLHQKIAFPFGNIVILMVGLPLALMSGRRKAVGFTSLGIAIGVGFLFQILNAVCLAFGKGGAFPPIIAAWLAPAIFLATALYLIKTKF